MELRYIVPPEAEGQRLGMFLRTRGVTAGLIKSVKHRGEGFRADGTPLHTDQPVHTGQQITFTLPPEQETSVSAQPIPLEIAYEDDFAAVLDKPAGLAVHPTLNYPDHTLANGWIYHLKCQGLIKTPAALCYARKMHLRPLYWQMVYKNVIWRLYRGKCR